MGSAGSQTGQTTQGQLRAAAHELANVLTPLVVHAKSLAESEADPQKKRRLQKVLRSCRTMSRLVRSLCSSGSIFRPSFEPVYATDVVREATDEVELLAAEHGVRLSIFSPDQAESTPVLADRELVRRMLVNLIQNAVRVSPPGSEVTVVARVEGAGTRLAVLDRGPGFPGGDIHSLPAGYTTRRGKGHGTGLSVCRTIARLHHTALKSRHIDGGAEVSFLLHSKGAFRPPSSVTPLRLLVVDDDPVISETIRFVLSDQYDVTCAQCVNEALSLLGREAFDILLVDLEMHPLSGPDLLAELNRRKLNPPGRIVFMTGDPAPQLPPGMRDHPLLQKPFDSDTLTAALLGNPAAKPPAREYCGGYPVACPVPA